MSAHGCACDPVAECLTPCKVFFLTGGGRHPCLSAAELAAAGLGDAHALVGKTLAPRAEAIRFGPAQELAQSSLHR